MSQCICALVEIGLVLESLQFLSDLSWHFWKTYRLLHLYVDHRSKVSDSLCIRIFEIIFFQGYDASELAYIKPCTQCVSVQMITKFCESKGIKQVSLGPVVYKRGYTYDAIDEINGTNEERMEAVLKSVLDIGKGKKVVVVDGVVTLFFC